MTKAEKRFGGKTVVKLDPIREMLTSKLMADTRDLIALLSKAETMGEYEEQQRLLDEMQASHRALHVLNGTLTIEGEAILMAPKTAGSIQAPDRTAENVGSIAVGQAIDGLAGLNSADEYTRDKNQDSGQG